MIFNVIGNFPCLFWEASCCHLLFVVVFLKKTNSVNIFVQVEMYYYH